MTGVDPAPANVGRRPGAAPRGERRLDRRRRRRESAPLAADLAIMTGHVAQFFVSDESWSEALTAPPCTRSAPAGRLAFESRNPQATGVGALDPRLRVRDRRPRGGADRGMVRGARRRGRDRLVRQPLRVRGDRRRARVAGPVAVPDASRSSRRRSPTRASRSSACTATGTGALPSPTTRELIVVAARSRPSS